MVTSSLVPVKPFPLPPTHEPTLEIAEFPSLRVEDAFPHMSFVNHLYVYPRTLKYDAQKTFHRARNLSCVIELRDSDTKDAKSLKVRKSLIFSKINFKFLYKLIVSIFQCIYGHIGQLKMVSHWISSVSHHNTTPSWLDEIKINLPTPLNSKHHLLFTFLHVSCDLSKQKKDRDSKESSGPESIVGYSWLPLLHKGRLRVEGQQLPVSAHLPPGYLSFEPLGLGRGVRSNNLIKPYIFVFHLKYFYFQYAGPEIRWVDGQKPLFFVNLELLSTVTALTKYKNY